MISRQQLQTPGLAGKKNLSSAQENIPFSYNNALSLELKDMLPTLIYSGSIIKHQISTCIYAPPLPAGRSNKMPGFCLKHLISWEIKTLLKAVCNKSIKEYAVKSNWSHTGHASIKKPMLQCILHVAQHPESDLRKCLEFALKNTTEVGLRQAGRAAALWRGCYSLCCYCNQYQPFLTAQLDTSWASLLIFSQIADLKTVG